MQLLRPFWLFLSLANSILSAETTQYPKSVKISYTILGSSQSSAKPLAEVLYNPQTLEYHLSSWTPPSVDNLKSTSSDPQNSQLVRISLPEGGSSVTTLSTFDPALSQFIDLWLSSNSDAIFSASISSISPPPLTEEQIRLQRKEERLKARGKEVPTTKTKPKSSKKKKAEEVVDLGPVVKVNLLKQVEGPQPKLNSRKPPQVDSEGKEVPQEEVQEKTFFQKYWWVFLAATFLMMGSGGGEK